MEPRLKNDKITDTLLELKESMSPVAKIRHVYLFLFIQMK